MRANREVLSIWQIYIYIYILGTSINHGTLRTHRSRRPDPSVERQQLYTLGRQASAQEWMYRLPMP